METPEYMAPSTPATLYCVLYRLPTGETRTARFYTMTEQCLFLLNAELHGLAVLAEFLGEES